MRITTASWLVLILFLILAPLGVAESAITVTPIKNLITLSEEASFKLIITNQLSVPQRYTIYSLQSGQGWNVHPSPLQDRVIEIKGGGSHATTIVAEPLESYNPGIYYVQVVIEGDSGEQYAEALKMYLAPDKPLNYLPTIFTTVDMNEKINPQATVPIKLILENRNPLDMKNLTVRIESDIPEFSQQAIISLPPLEHKTVEMAITPNKFQQPKDYKLFFILEYQGEPVKVVEKKIEIIPVIPAFSVNVENDPVFLKYFYRLTVHNGGNVLNTQTVKVPLSYAKILFSTDHNAVITEESGARYLTWELSLNPNETKILNFTINFRILFYIGVLILLFLIFYLYVKSPVVINKSAVTSRSADGGVSEIKVTLEVQNKSNKPLRSLMVIDKIPEIANLEKSLDLGTLKPQEIKHTKQGTKVHWSLIELDASEHRIITYKIKAKLNILGSFTLPRAVVEFKLGKRSGKAYSNAFCLES